MFIQPRLYTAPVRFGTFDPKLPDDFFNVIFRLACWQPKYSAGIFTGLITPFRFSDEANGRTGYLEIDRKYQDKPTLFIETENGQPLTPPIHYSIDAVAQSINHNRFVSVEEQARLMSLYEAAQAELSTKPSKWPPQP